MQTEAQPRPHPLSPDRADAIEDAAGTLAGIAEAFAFRISTTGPDNLLELLAETARTLRKESRAPGTQLTRPSIYT